MDDNARDPNEKSAWGFASYDVDDNEYDPTIIYTRHEKSGSVNQYVDNGDGGHGHFYWKDEEDYENEESPDYGRCESNDSENPDQGEVEDRSGCYLTTACMQHYKVNFEDDCYELNLLRWFRDTMVLHKEIQDYYKYAPRIVEGINANQHKEQYYEFIYQKVVADCVQAIEKSIINLHI